MAAQAGARTADVEGQLAELQRKYRIMEGNRKSYSEGSQKVIAHQRETIEKLKEENQRLTSELELETKASAKPPTLAYQERLSRAQDAADQYTRKIELEKRKVEELSRAIEMCEAKFLEMRKKMGGLHSAKENNMQVAKQVKVRAQPESGRRARARPPARPPNRPADRLTRDAELVP